MGEPIIGVLSTWSGTNSCHGHFRERAQNVIRGVAKTGGFAVELPSMSVDESFIKPISMLYRNMLAIETEEQIRAHPLGGVVLMGGCDKSTPGLVIGAIAAGVPMIYLPAGPTMHGNYAGWIPGSGSDAWKYWDERRAGNVSDAEWLGLQGGIARSVGTCMTMGTASTMTAIVDAMGLTLPGAASIPAPDSGPRRMSAACGWRIVSMVWEDLIPDRIVTEASCRNAAVVAMATGCSTKAVAFDLNRPRSPNADRFDPLPRGPRAVRDGSSKTQTALSRWCT